MATTVVRPVKTGTDGSGLPVLAGDSGAFACK